jgi:poly(glycerol-phosphate) alpha-glucosyltransferase
VENQAMMFGLTSRMEGFNLAVMEGIAHGLISFTYDVNYGPNEIVENDVNGNVVPYGDYEAMAQAIIKVLQDQQLAQRYSTGAYTSAERYSEKQVWQAWQVLLDDAQASWPAKLRAMPEFREDVE